MTAFAFYAFASGGPSILEWIYPNELFPTEVRATAVGVAVGISRIGLMEGAIRSGRRAAGRIIRAAHREGPPRRR
ncbi:hypothetical protein [Nonomuraea typhae]|uniref:hypothetical protein n=1 Tax=Nonomuraea typhae TaxID=2603600 RepID=UPI001CA4952F|nr:hypothetical protein [Nonomuraea typhae]